MSNPYYTQPAGYPQAPPSAPVPVPPAYGQPPAPQYAPPPAQYAQPYAPPAPPAYGAPQGPGPYGQPPGYGYGAPAPAYGVPPQAPTVHGSMDAFGSQPSGGGGPGISFKDAPFGTTYQMTVKRDARDADVIQDRQPASQGGALKTRRDGSPQWVLTVPVYLPTTHVYQGGPAFPEGEATLYVRSGIRDALVDAYGGEIKPLAGDQITLTLTERKQVQNAAIPKNVFRAQVLRNGQPIAAGQPQAAQAPAPQAPPVQQEAPPAWAAPQPQGPPQVAQQVQYQAPPVQQEAPQAPQYQPQGQPQAPAPQAPPAQPQAAPGPIQGLPPMDPAQLALLQRLQGQA